MDKKSHFGIIRLDHSKFIYRNPTGIDRDVGPTFTQKLVGLNNI